MAVVELSVKRASGGSVSRCARRAARDRFALHWSKAATSASLQVTAW